MFKRMILVVAVLALAAPVTSWAGTLQFYDAAAGEGNTNTYPGPVSGLVLDLDYNASSAENGGIFGFGELVVLTTGGDLTIDSFACQAVSCTFSTTGNTRLEATGGDTSSGETGVHDFGTISLSGFGRLELVSGNYFDFGFGVQTVEPRTLAIVTPEPGTLVLLGAGLAGLAFIRRRSA